MNPQNYEWMPLGVFAITEDRAVTGDTPTLYMQLAVSKDGIISGTFKNMTSGEVKTLEGMVDKKTHASPGACKDNRRRSSRQGFRI